MIKTQKEYENMRAQIEAERATLEKQRDALKADGLTAEQVEIAMEPLLSFHEQLVEEVQTYERIMARDFQALENFESMGRLLIALRIAKGVSQRELSIRLKLSESQVSRDEADEYHGATLTRVTDVLKALGFRIQNRVSVVDEQEETTAV